MILKRETTELYYEETGAGKPLILIHGVTVDSYFFAKAATYLSAHFRVITFDRRGNSRSTSEGPFDIDTQADDVLALMDHLGIESAYIAGASAGSIVGIHTLLRAPQRVKKLCLYEPPLLALLADQEDVTAFIGKMKDLRDRRKISTALLAFSASIASYDDRGEQKPSEVALRELNNFTQTLKNEFDTFIEYVPDVAALRAYRDRIMVGVGEKSDHTYYVRAAERLCEQLDTTPLHFPGYHNLPYDLPKEYAINLLGAFLL